MLNPSGVYVLRAWAPRVLPPPALDAEIENGATQEVEYQSAAEAGYSDTRAPCKENSEAYDYIAARRCLIVYYFMNLEIAPKHVGAITIGDGPNNMDAFIIRCKQALMKLGSATFSILGDTKRDCWFARTVVGHVTLHDAHVHLFNTQVDILINTFPYDEEADDEDIANIRIEMLVLLRVTFWERRSLLVKLYDDTLAEIVLHSNDTKEDREWLATRGMYTDPEYAEHLRQQRDQVAAMTLWDPITDEDLIPQKLSTYAERFDFEQTNRFLAFWVPIFSEPGVLEGMFKAFREVLCLEACVHNDECKAYMMTLAANCAHYTWLRWAWREEEDSILAARDVRTPQGKLIVLKCDPKDPFQYLRELVSEVSQLTFDDVMVRTTESPKGLKRKRRT